ncbi:hypothetical protein GQ53DRAFT_674272 [Thozetella sp. PMI_491]|nr:hypothetical protein GQ53DRAFT_674272 [Thozetella sp. PMI_491]
MSRASLLSDSHEASPQRSEERGSLRTLRDGKSQFIGSASGIYFVNTVRRAFSDANTRLSLLLQDTAHPSPEDCIVDNEEEADASRASQDHGASDSLPSPLPTAAQPTVSSTSYGLGIPLDLGQPPPADVAKTLFMEYFQTWHRFFPFLHGPSALKDIELLYASPAARKQPVPLARVIILQCLFNLASLHSSEGLLAASRIEKPENILSILPGIAVKGDIVSIQALFAAQLLLVARMSLRSATVVGGLVSRAIFLAGLHRCPVRYQELSTDDCDIRKRLFWSIYVIDRYLSQAFGHPIGIQDSDVDVCSLAGPELHRHLQHYPSDSLGTPTPSSRLEVHDRHHVLSFQVVGSRLIGRALELFHKSLHVRSMDQASILSLRTDVNAWWNALPSHLQDFAPSAEINSASGTSGAPTRGQRFSPSAFFVFLHGQMVLLIHRPWLSLEPSSPEFRSALQVCIGAARDIINIMRKQHNAGYALFWSGYLSALWMAGIILAFACHLRLYPAEKGQDEIGQCLEVLSAMSDRWHVAKNCYTVLSDLQRILEEDKLSANNPHTIESTPLAGGLDRGFDQQSARQESTYTPHDAHNSRKRRRTISQTATGEERNRHYIHVQDRLRVDPNRFGPPPISTPSTDPSGAVFHQPSFPDLSDGTMHFSLSQGGQENPNYLPGTHRASQDALPVDGRPNSGTPGVLNIPGPRFGGTDAPWLADPTRLSGWDGGMPDLLAGATWESLLQAIDQADLGWGGVLFQS